ncbi:GMC oxidoreductase [Actinosynnema sp. NPDC023587]|uniref:GMC oxidoreductase n=1 Tax=Actinosynnema sp. NPDC023587 TaxID=3154695 RepID=UPI0034111A19
MARPAGKTSVREEHRQAVVVGSGFGGAVAALRLAEAGVPTLVLERGRRWRSGPAGNPFPRLSRPDRRMRWPAHLSPPPDARPELLPRYAGLVERVVGHGMRVLCGAGVGGGSLHYGGASIRPSEELFGRVMPSGVDFEEMDLTYYPRAAAVLRLSPIPDDVLRHERYTSSRRFLADARTAGLRTFRIPQPMDWDVVRKELSGELPPWSTCGEVHCGVNNDARYSVDKTYLAAAEATGLCEVAPLHIVRDLAGGTDHRYTLTCDRVALDGTVLEHVKVSTNVVFLAAGSVGTSRLLVRARGTRALPDLPDEVGEHWGNNGDRIYLRALLPYSTLPHQGGPACVGAHDWESSTMPTTVQHIPLPFGIETRTALLGCMGLPDGRGAFRYEPGTGAVGLTWARAADRGAGRAAQAAVARLTDAGGGVAVNLTAGYPLTVHPLGGAVIGPVCDQAGRVHGHPGLHVTDSALIPGSTGCCNPSWTITALAERCMHRLLSKGTDFC